MENEIPFLTDTEIHAKVEAFMDPGSGLEYSLLNERPQRRLYPIDKQLSGHRVEPLRTNIPMFITASRPVWRRAKADFT